MPGRPVGFSSVGGGAGRRHRFLGVKSPPRAQLRMPGLPSGFRSLFRGPRSVCFPAAFLALSALREVSPLPLAALPFRNMHAHPFPALFLVFLRWTRPAANLCVVFILETFQAVQPITYSATLPRQFIICFMDLETVRSPCSRKGVADAERNPAGLTGGAALLRQPRISVPVGSAGFVLLRSCASLPRGRQSQDFRPRRDSTAHSASPTDGEREGGGHSLSFYRPVSDNGVGRFSTPLFNSYFLELLLGARHYVGC